MRWNWPWKCKEASLHLSVWMFFLLMRELISSSTVFGFKRVLLTVLLSFAAFRIVLASRFKRSDRFLTSIGSLIFQLK